MANKSTEQLRYSFVLHTNYNSGHKQCGTR
uniref:Uncharacterized protein n=1 Tax=Arundo donax TaxID=35708 RepID=A0A0A9AC19_ARUDO